jgi:RHS repeat-associated protein
MNASTSLLSNIYGYDAMSRLASVGDGSRTAAYTRVPGSDALASTTLSNSSGAILTTSRTYDNRSRMTSIASTAGATIRSYAYTYNDKDQRSRCTLADGSYWLYSYDDKGQVIGGVKHDASGVAIPGMSFGYDYDGIGNRKQETRGMPEMLFSYSSNLVNQYTQRSIPGIVPVAGSAVADSTVKVILPATGNIFDTSRNGAYYKAAIPVNNSAAGAETELTVIATKLDTDSNKDVINTISGKYFVPKTPQAFTYDPDGNMTSDGKWNYTWNAENRLIVAESADKRLEFAYDYIGRRVSKQVYTGSVGNWTLASESKYVYDGYYQIAEFDGSDNMLRSYLRVGGEIYAVTDTNQSATYFYMTDGNKNVMALVDASGNVQADYTYDPFGRIVSKSGAYADANAFRFSSEFHDTETNLVYYNYRYYSPDLGRWTKRDPIGENGGVNLYGFVNNRLGLTDIQGLLPSDAINIIKEDYSVVLGKAIGIGFEAGMNIFVERGEHCCKSGKYRGKLKEVKDVQVGLFFEFMVGLKAKAKLLGQGFDVGVKGPKSHFQVANLIFNYDECNEGFKSVTQSSSIDIGLGINRVGLDIGIVGVGINSSGSIKFVYDFTFYKKHADYNIGLFFEHDMSYQLRYLFFSAKIPWVENSKGSNELLSTTGNINY